MKRTLILATVVLLVAAYFGLGLDRYLTLAAVQDRLGDFEALRQASPIATALGFFGLYVLATALSLPGAVILTLAAGALFGLAGGTLIVSFASSLGATLAFLASRYLLRDSVQARFGDRLKAINDGMAKDGEGWTRTVSRPNRSMRVLATPERSGSPLASTTTPSVPICSNSAGSWALSLGLPMPGSTSCSATIQP